MTIEEFVKSLGVPEGKEAAAVTAAKKYLDGDYVTKARFNEVNESKKGLETQLTERDKQLESLKKNSGDSEALKAQIKELQTANETAKAESEAKIKELQFTNAIKLAVADKAQDTDIVSSLFDKDKLILSEDGKVTGLDEQLKTLMESKPFLFKGQTKPSYNPAGGGNPSTKNPFAKDTFNLTEQGKMLRDNPDQARAMAAEAGVTI
jgi:hypothetical protein